MAVGLRTRVTRGHTTSQTHPLIASMVAVNFGAATTPCSCVTSPTTHVPYTAESVANCPGLMLNEDPHINFGSTQNRVARGLRAMAVDEDSWEIYIRPRINKGAYDYKSSNETVNASSMRWDVIVINPASGKKYTSSITYEGDNFTPLERNTIGLSLGMLPSRDRIDLYESLRSAPDGTAQAALLAGAVLDYTRATASLAREIKDCARLYNKIRTDLVGVTEVEYTRDSVRMGLKFNPTSKNNRRKVTEMTNETYRKLSEEADCQLGEKGDCPDWVERLALLELQFRGRLGQSPPRLWQEPTPWEKK